MPRKKGPCCVSIEDAAFLMGMNAQSLRLSLQNGYYKNIGLAAKCGPKQECWSYTISKFGLFQHLGLDVNYTVEETLQLVRRNKPPFIKQIPIPIEIFDKAMELLKQGQIKEDA